MEIQPPSPNEEPEMPQVIFPPLTVLLFLLMFIILSSLVGSLLVAGIANVNGIDIQEMLTTLTAESPPGERNFIRLVNMVSHLMTFAVPALAVSIFLFRKRWADVLSLNKTPVSLNLGLGALLIIFSFPFAQLTYWLNKLLPLPSWATSMEESTMGMLEGLLTMDSAGEFLLTLFVVAVLPAIGEELVFRGLVQKKLEEHFKKPHLAIWITAILFSAIHLQFEGFFPRMILGAILGYLFFWTKNLWVPIFAHFILNGTQIAAQYFFADQMNPSQNTAPMWVPGIISLGLLVMTGQYIRSQNQARWQKEET